MRSLNRHHVASRASVVIATLLVACSTDMPTNVVAPGAPLYQRPSAGPTYTSLNLGTLSGDNSSRANGVNNAGEVVGYSCCSVGNRAFVRLSGVLTALDGTNALAISNGTTRYIVGSAGSTSQPVKWIVTGSTASQASYLGVGTANFGAARGVNAVGQAVGNAGNDAAMWDEYGNLTLIATPQGFVSGEGRGINDTGDAVFVFSRPDAAWPNGISIGYLRLSTGELIELPPETVDGISYANAISPRIGNTIQVAGTTDASPTTPRAVRWTVDVLTQAIQNTERRTETSHAVAISGGGAVAGFVEGPTSSLKSNAFEWETALLTLNPPKSGKEGKAWAISPNATFVAGEAYIAPSRTAILWTISRP